MDNPRVRLAGQRSDMTDLLAPATPNRDLMRLALGNPTRAQIKELAPTITEIEATIAAATTAITPIAELADADRAAAIANVRDALKPLGAKVIPTVSEEQGRAWLVAVAAGLDDLPARFVLKAARDALRQVFRFPNEVEAAVRDGATEMVNAQRRAIRLLHAMKADLERAANPPQPKVEHQPRPWTVERVRATPRFLIDLGLAGGFIAQAIVDEAFQEGLPTEETSADHRRQESASEAGSTGGQHDTIGEDRADGE